MSSSRKFASAPLTGILSRLPVILVLAGTFVNASLAGAADSTDVEIHLKAAFIYNFARFVEWPPHPVGGPIQIGVLGHGDLASPLGDIVRGKSVGGRAIKVVPVASPAEAENCEILVIEHSESKHGKDIAQALAAKPVLTVSDDQAGLRDGIMIAFQVVDDSVRFQINQEAASRTGLKISSQLLKVAIPAEGKRP